jgi:hypothetical protein
MASPSITISTTAAAAGSNLVLAGSVHFKMIRFAKIIRSAVFNGLALGLLALPALAAQPVALPANLPLYFEAGPGPANVPAQFIARGHDYQFLISPTEAQIALRQAGAEPAVVHMQFAGANPQALIRSDAELPGKVNYLTGGNPALWRTGVSMFAQVRVSELYPGVNLVYYGNQRLLEYDITIAPGASPQVIAMHFDGVDKISINPQGELILSLAGGEICQPKPVIYQTISGARKDIEGGYRLVDAQTVAFVVGKYDRNQPLVIDPVLGFSTYFGGTAGDTAWAVALDTNGFAYVTGETFSQQFYTNGWSGGPAFSTYGAFQTNFHGGKLTGDAFVAKLDISSGTAVVYYLTYLGGSADDGAFGVAVDSAGDAYVTGFTDSPDFPTTNAITMPGYNGKNISGVLDKGFGYYPIDAFVTELDPSGSNLVYSTYLGGSSMDCGMGIAVDAAGYAYVTGYTYSSNFPTFNALQKKLACTNSFYFNANAFIAKISPGGTNLVYSTYFGGTNFDEGRGIAVDSSNSVYVTGFTASTNFPATNYVQQLIGGNWVDGHWLNGSTKKTPSFDAFVAKFDSTGTNLVYSTLLGGTNNDVANGIAVDTNGAAYVTGWTVSTNFPNTAGLYSFVATNKTSFPATNVFLTKITYGTNAVIAWSAVFGGKGMDMGSGVALDPAGDVFVTGSASSTNFPTYNVPGLMQMTNSGKSDAFVIAFNSTNTTGTNLLYSVYLGGKADDYGYGIAVDNIGNAYVVGQTLSTNFPTYHGAQTLRNGTNDAFLAEIILTVQSPVITVPPTNQTVGVNSNATFSVTVTGTPPLYYQWQENGTNLVDGTTIAGSIISGSTNDVLTISGAQTNDSGNYQVIITNYAGSTSSPPAALTVMYFPPYLTLQPTNQTVGVGSTATFSVAGFAASPYFFQWQKDGTNLTDVTNISGSIISGSTSSAALTIYNAQTNDDGGYLIIVTNYGGSVTSSVAILTVLTSPSFTSITVAGGTNGGFILNGVGGTNNGIYYMLTTTNLLLPLTNWTPVATNHFDSTGHFILTNTAQTNASQEFYLLQSP